MYENPGTQNRVQSYMLAAVEIEKMPGPGRKVTTDNARLWVKTLVPVNELIAPIVQVGSMVRLTSRPKAHPKMRGLTVQVSWISVTRAVPFTAKLQPFFITSRFGAALAHKICPPVQLL